MIRICIWLTLLSFTLGHSQATLTHFGGMQLHPGANLGVHGNLMNLAAFEQDVGLIGFYGPENTLVSGDSPLVVYDTEISTESKVLLNLSLAIKNNMNFVLGDFETGVNTLNPTLTFLSGSFPNGPSNFSKVIGYAEAVITDEFMFPVGNNAQLRPIKFNSEVEGASIRAGYFSDNPTLSTNFGQLDSLAKPRELKTIGQYEFWRLEGKSAGVVTLFWNLDSNLRDIVPDLEQLELIGWHKVDRAWHSIGTTLRSGDLTEGFAVSDSFIPDTYEVLTFGGRRIPKKLYALDNYYLSPNGDGVNDFLEIEALLDHPNNEFSIYDRRGLLVFSAKNYIREFQGISNTSNTINRDSGLPEGVYFYVIHLLDTKEMYQGFLYLNR